MNTGKHVLQMTWKAHSMQNWKGIYTQTRWCSGCFRQIWSDSFILRVLKLKTDDKNDRRTRMRKSELNTFLNGLKRHQILVNQTSLIERERCYPIYIYTLRALFLYTLHDAALVVECNSEIEPRSCESNGKECVGLTMSDIWRGSHRR